MAIISRVSRGSAVDIGGGPHLWACMRDPGGYSVYYPPGTRGVASKRTTTPTRRACRERLHKDRPSTSPFAQLRETSRHSALHSVGQQAPWREPGEAWPPPP